MKHEHYSYRVTWSEEDREFIGCCEELPGLSHLAQTPAAALEGIFALVADTAADMDASGEALPAPLATHAFSGELAITISPQRHRMLAIEAAEAGLSMDRYISIKLAGSIQNGSVVSS